MHIVDDKIEGKRVKLAQYDSVNDFALRLLNCDKHAQSYLDRSYEGWAGGNRDTTLRGCRGEDHSYAERADKFVTQFGNVAVQAQGIDMEFNHEQGDLDIGGWLSGEPEHLYGPTFTKTDRAPVAITVDQWIWSGCTTDTIERRGVAAMALAQALSMYRPVMLYVVLADRHVPSDTDAVQIIPAPSNPMDTARCAFMLASPAFVRAGMMAMLHQIAKSSASCSIPSLSAGIGWQSTELGNWLAPRVGVDEDNIIHLPMMLDNQTFGTDADAQAWVNKNVEKYA